MVAPLAKAAFPSYLYSPSHEQVAFPVQKKLQQEDHAWVAAYQAHLFVFFLILLVGTKVLYLQGVLVAALLMVYPLCLSYVSFHHQLAYMPKMEGLALVEDATLYYYY